MFTPEQYDRFQMLDNFFAQKRIATVTYWRGTDSERTLVTVNGIVEQKTNAPAAPGFHFLWLTKAGAPRFTLRGEIVSSDGRTESRADGKLARNTSRSTREGAKKSWPYWSLFADNIVQIVADGVVYSFDGGEA